MLKTTKVLILYPLEGPGSDAHAFNIDLRGHLEHKWDKLATKILVELRTLFYEKKITNSRDSSRAFYARTDGNTAPQQSAMVASATETPISQERLDVAAQMIFDKLVHFHSKQDYINLIKNETDALKALHQDTTSLFSLFPKEIISLVAVESAKLDGSHAEVSDEDATTIALNRFN